MVVLRWLGWALLALILAGLAFVGWNVFGKPYSLRVLADRQALVSVLASPETFTSLGLVDGTLLDFHSGKLDDISLAARDKDRALTRKLNAELEAYADPASYKGQDALTYAVLHELYAQELAAQQFDWGSASGFVYAADQQWAPPTGIATFLQNIHQISNAKLARNYLSRLRAAGPKLDAVGVEVLRQADLGVILPTFLLDKTIKGMTDFLAPEPKDNSVFKDFVAKLEGVKGMSPSTREELSSQALVVMTDDVYPAYRRLIATMEGLRSRSSNDAGVWKLPNGDAFYAAMIRSQTTTDYTADQIHEIGLKEVARIETEMDALLKAEGLTDGAIGARMQILSRRADQVFPDSDAGREQVLEGYRAILKTIETDIVPRSFARTPKAAVEIRRMQPFEEVGAPGAYYNPPALDGSRPGVFYANLREIVATPRLSMPTLVAHEASPGHHFQIALAQELKGLPIIRTVGLFTAYVEGWALYAERLVWEEGLYQNDRPGDLGRLRDEMFRAVRLVVDTGIHAKRWTRDEAITYMVDKTGMAPGEIENEIDRYITGPGQALAYKLGQLKILELRQRAKDALGERFDLKAFHSLVLDNGALPLTVLDEEVDRWIAAQKG